MLGLDVQAEPSGRPDKARGGEMAVRFYRAAAGVGEFLQRTFSCRVTGGYTGEEALQFVRREDAKAVPRNGGARAVE